MVVLCETLPVLQLNTFVKFSRELNRLLVPSPLFSLFSGQVPSRDHALGIVHVIKTPSLCV